MAQQIAILGAGKLGTAIAEGLIQSGRYTSEQITLTAKKNTALKGLNVSTDNRSVVENHSIIFICVLPQQLDTLLHEISPSIRPHHQVISTVTGVSIASLRNHLGHACSVLRAMPNTAISIRQSMTCICRDEHTRNETAEFAQSVFSLLGQCMEVRESQMEAATALCACGIAFFMRAIRAASQGGIEIGFHAEQALQMAAQTALGAAALLLEKGNHPEHEIDHVTSPQGCTIAGLNQMEHAGFSSAMIKGITTSAEKAKLLYTNQ